MTMRERLERKPYLWSVWAQEKSTGLGEQEKKVSKSNQRLVETTPSRI